MNIIIFGATGRTGQLLVEKALERGHQVTAFARSPEKLTGYKDQLEIVQGDARDAGKVAEAVSGAEAVISVLGPAENRPVFAVSQATENILSAMKDQGVKRLILSAGAGVEDPQDAPRLFNRLINFLLKLFSRWVYEDMVRTVEQVRSSDLQWTVVRVPMLVDGEESEEVQVGYVGKGMGPRVSRADLAAFMLDQLSSSEYVQQAPAIST
jgi:putative NADH-flavin reductase